jgi:hypothetical protein
MIRRREFIAGLRSTAAWPVVARGQQAAVPVIRFLSNPLMMTTGLLPFRSYRA